MAVATTAEADGLGEMVGDGETDSASVPLETVHAESKNAVAAASGRLKKVLGRTRQRARGADRARARCG